jgi:hypothetical protein
VPPNIDSLSGQPVNIHFSDFFSVAPAMLEEYGAFNVSLINDLPLFIDPFLLFDSKEARYQALHDEIIQYLKFLRDASADQDISAGLLDSWFRFPEVKQNWLGFSKTGNNGSGLGADFARGLRRNLHHVFSDFGSESITRGSHLEKLCLFGDGVGRDHLSDFTTNLIKRFLLEYTQTFAQTHLHPKFRRDFPIDKVTFDYEKRRWLRGTYNLPLHEKDFVLLTPKDILTKDDAWINRGDLLDQIEHVYTAVPDAQLRAQVESYFMSRLSEDAGKEEQREAAAKTIEKYPVLIDHFIRLKEDHGEEAHRLSDLKVRETQEQFVDQIRFLVSKHLQGTEFYSLGDSYSESMRRVQFLKDVIENKDGYRAFYEKGRPIKSEVTLQIMYRLTWYATAHDVNREVNNGRGPADFKVSRGSADKALIEFKLASNSKLKRNLEKQVGIYETANNTRKSITVILYFNDSELQKVMRFRQDLGLNAAENIILIDANQDNKPSASVA